MDATAVFTLLRNDRRRAVVSYLAREGTADSVEELSQAVAAVECGVRPEHVTDRQHKCAYVSLLQSHLPRLADEGLLEWNGPGEPVEPIGPVSSLASVVALIEEACSGTGVRVQRSRESR